MPDLFGTPDRADLLALLASRGWAKQSSANACGHTFEFWTDPAGARHTEERALREARRMWEETKSSEG